MSTMLVCFHLGGGGRHQFNQDRGSRIPNSRHSRVQARQTKCEKTDNASAKQIGDHAERG